MVAGQKTEWRYWYCTIKLFDFAVREDRRVFILFCLEILDMGMGVQTGGGGR